MTSNIGPQTPSTFMLIGPTGDVTKFDGVKYDAILEAFSAVNDGDSDPEQWTDDDNNTVVGYVNGPQVTIVDIGE